MQTYKNKQLGNKGFTLFEVLIALSLISLLLSVVPTGSFDSDHDKLEALVDDFDRAVRFSQNEAILRNSLVRLRMILSSYPMEYVIEYGPSGDFVLPESVDESRLSLKEREELKKQSSQIDSQFNRVAEFSEKNKTIEEPLFIAGIATNTLDKIKTTEEISIYFYPTGEKDESMIFLSTQDELAYLKIPAFEYQTKADFYIYTSADKVDLEQSIESKMKELYSEWTRE